MSSIKTPLFPADVSNLIATMKRADDDDVLSKNEADAIIAQLTPEAVKDPEVARIALNFVVQRDAWLGDSALNVDLLTKALLGAGMTPRQLDLVPMASSPDEFDALPDDEKMKALRWKSAFIGIDGSMVTVEKGVNPQDVLAPEELGKAAAEMLFKNGNPDTFGVLKRDGEVYGYRFRAGDNTYYFDRVFNELGREWHGIAGP
jgi:hypothetical protein